MTSKISLLFAFATALTTLSAQADDVPNCPAPASDGTRNAALASVPIGYRCRTSKGAIVERVTSDYFGEAWQGPNGLIWSDRQVNDDSALAGYQAEDGAEHICNDLGARLPSKGDFADNAKYGLSQVLPHMGLDQFWSRSKPFFDPKNGYVCSMGDEGGDRCFEDMPGHLLPVRCVTKKRSEAPSPNLKLCQDPSVDLRHAPVGFKCRTTRDAVYERMDRPELGEAWKGPDGAIWGDYIGDHTLEAGERACQGKGGATVPSLADIERAEASGFREVLTGLSGRIFWSATHWPPNPQYAFRLVGEYGLYDWPDLVDKTLSVRCVGR